MIRCTDSNIFFLISMENPLGFLKRKSILWHVCFDLSYGRLISMENPRGFLKRKSVPWHVWFDLSYTSSGTPLTLGTLNEQDLTTGVVSGHRLLTLPCLVNEKAKRCNIAVHPKRGPNQRSKLARKGRKCTNISIYRLCFIVLSKWKPKKYFFSFEFDLLSAQPSWLAL